MRIKFIRVAATLLLTAVMLVVTAAGASAISANVTMKVSRTAQDSIVNAGEDLTIDVQLDGIEPDCYRWFFEDQLIEDAESRVLVIRAATLEDAGSYRMEAYAEDGSMLVSMDFAVRVIDNALPKSGDSTLGVAPVAAMMAMCAGGVGLLARRMRRA